MHNEFSQTEQTYITSTQFKKHYQHPTVPLVLCSSHFLPLCKGNHDPKFGTEISVHAFLLYTNVITEYSFVSDFFCSTFCLKDSST